jgi:hypothetical protein
LTDRILFPEKEHGDKAIFNHDISHRHIADKDIELLEFTTDPAIAPIPILPRDTMHQIANDLSNL